MSGTKAAVWVASYRWNDCDPIAQVAGADKDAVERAVHEAMDEEIAQRTEGDEEGPIGYLAWSGLHLFNVDQLKIDAQQQREIDAGEVVFLDV